MIGRKPGAPQRCVIAFRDRFAAIDRKGRQGTAGAMDEFTTKLLKATLRAFYHSRLDELLAPVTRGAGAIFMLHHVVPAPPPAFAPNRILTITPKFA
jgi:hypothetical protein